MRNPWISKVRMKIRCYEGKREDCEKIRKIAGQWFKADNVDLLIFTERSANEECSDVGPAFVIKKIKNGQIWKIRSDEQIQRGSEVTVESVFDV